MKKSAFVFFVFLLLVSSLAAQVRTGNIYGNVVDANGAALAGVKVTLTGSVTAPVTFVSTGGGIFRFLSLPPSDDYSLRAEMAGFKTTVRDKVLIVAGVNVELTLTMEQGSESEEVKDTSSQKVLDATKSTIAAQLTTELLQEPPSARDPFNTNKMAPSVTSAREDVGGSEGGQAVSVSARGAPASATTGVAGGTENMQLFDGVPIPWTQSSNATAFYFNFDTFKEINVTVGGSDVSSQTAGVMTNIVTHRGSNALSFGGRFYFTDSKFQMDNMTDEMKQQGLVGTSKVNVIRDYGFHLGGPIIKNKVWFYGAYGMQDIQTISIYGVNQNTTLETLVGKLDLALVKGNRLEFFAQGNKKLMWGTAGTFYNPEGTRRLSLYPFGYPLIIAQDEQMIGDNLFLSLRAGWYNSGYIMDPSRDPDNVQLAINDLRDKRGYGGYSAWWSSDPAYAVAGSVNYFIEKLAGVAHDIKAGFEWTDRKAQSTELYPGNLRLDRNFIDPVADFTGDGNPDIPTSSKFYGLRFGRGTYDSSTLGYNYFGVTGVAGYISDNMATGRFNLYVGLRYDLQTPRVNPYTVAAIVRSNPATTNTLTNRTIDLFDALLPALDVPEVKGKAADGSDYYWKTFSPRISLTYDITGDGKTLAKVAFAQYGQYMTTNEAARYKPGGTGGWMYFYWQDNGDNKADFNELYWYTVLNKKYQLYRVFDDAGNFVGNWDDGADIFWYGFDRFNLGKIEQTGYVRIDADAQDYRTTEIFGSLERELFKDFGIQINAVYRKYDNFRRSIKYFPATDKLIDENYYVSAGKLPASIPGVGDTGEAKNNDWYYLNATATAYSPYTWIKQNPDYTSDYYGLDFQIRKRMSNKWSANGSVSLQWASPHWGDNGVFDQTNRWALDGVSLATPWTAKLSGVYQFPWDLNFSVNLSARAGWRIDRTVSVTDYRLPNPKSNTAKLYLDPTGAEFLPAMINLSVRGEKMFPIMGTGRMYVMIDLFNVANLSTAEQRDPKLYGNYYIYTDASQNKFVPNINYYRLTKVLNPFVARIGVRFNF